MMNDRGKSGEDRAKKTGGGWGTLLLSYAIYFKVFMSDLRGFKGRFWAP